MERRQIDWLKTDTIRDTTVDRLPLAEAVQREWDIEWKSIEEARDDPFQMTDRGWTDSCYQKEEIIRDSLL